MVSMDRPAILDIDPEAHSAAKVWNHWRHKFENFTRTSKVTEDEKLRLLVNYVSPNIYEHIRCCLTYKDAVAALKTCFFTPNNELSAQFRLFSRKQKSGESAENYMEALQALSRACRSACDPCRDDTLRGLFVTGLSRPHVRLKLLENNDLTLAEVVNQAKALEMPQADSEHTDVEYEGDGREPDDSVSDCSAEDPVTSAAPNKANASKITSKNLPINALIKRIDKENPSEQEKNIHTARSTNESIQKSTRAEYLCYYCNARYYNKANLVKHMHKHIGGLPVYACDWCDYKAKVIGDLNRHITRHTGERRFACELCDYKGRLRRHLTQHLRVHTGEKPYACVLCGFRASQKFSLVKHVRRYHTGEKLYACTECNFRAFTSDEVNVHKRTHTGEKPYACASCDYKCATRTSLKKHILRHESKGPEAREKKFTCDQCEFKTHDKHYLKRHKDKHRYETGDQKKLTCNICGFKSAFNYTMKNHMSTHNGIKPFKCTLCNYSSITSNLLKLHTIAKHTGEGKYTCDLCPYATPVKMRLARHKMTHTGEKPHSCDICGYRAALKENVVAHRKTHTGEKRYTCGQCSYSTNKKSQLSEHARTHQEAQVQGQERERVEAETTTNQVFVGPELQPLTASSWPSGPSIAIPNLWSPGKFH